MGKKGKQNKQQQAQASNLRAMRPRVKPEAEEVAEKPTQGKYSAAVLHAMCTELMDDLNDTETSGLFVLSSKLGGRCSSYGVGNGTAIISGFASLMVSDENIANLMKTIMQEYEGRLAQQQQEGASNGQAEEAQIITEQ
jgi:hypothetical protein